jgi:two-component system, NtrC family, response regulator AtoC
MTKPNDTTTLRGETTAQHARTTLVLYHRDGAEVVHMTKARPVVVGRTSPADVVIADRGLSRQHARFIWNDDDDITVEDLGSTNGTKKNGQRVDRATIAPGDEVAMGPVLVSVHAVASTGEELRGFDGIDRFRSTLADEITRARTFARPLALVLVRAVSKDAHVSRWSSRLRAQLRPVDRVGVYGPSAVLVAIPEASPDMVRAWMARLAGGSPELTCSSATFPNDGASADELITALHAAQRGAPRDASDHGAVIVKTPAMKQIMQTVKRLAASTIAVLINGETGTGKEVIARAIHEGGPRKKQPLRSINCAAIPGMLIESVLFGHEQGAFTSADKSARGIFEQASGGTVLLDEIGELAPNAQAALLRVLETKKVTRVGGDKEISVDVRVIAATHRDLEAMVAEGKFRQDLLYRLNTMMLRLPPLRERVDEIKPLAMRFLEDANAQAGTSIGAFDPAAMAALEAYAWPGNVRELRNAIERAVVLAEGRAIALEDLGERIRAGSQTATPESEIHPSGELPADYKEHLRRYETELILRALHKTNGNQTEAAKALGLPLRTLVHKITTYGIKKRFDR